MTRIFDDLDYLRLSAFISNFLTEIDPDFDYVSYSVENYGDSIIIVSINIINNNNDLYCILFDRKENKLGGVKLENGLKDISNEEKSKITNSILRWILEKTI